jgi:hypothetical protein
VTEPAPPYRGEGPHALWHVSEDATIERFVPLEELVWAIDTRHLTFWATSETSDDDVERWLDGDRTRRVHVIESAWLERMRMTRVVAYRLPESGFEPEDRFWVTRETVEPLELVELGDLLARHAEARIELRVAPALYPLWDTVVASTLDFSGIRLRNATLSA